MSKIAVLDDDESWGFAIQRFFKNEFEVSTFSCADSFLEEIAQPVNQYDLVMVDLSLPSYYYKNIDGRKLIQHLRKILPNPPLLILVTAFISKNDLDSGDINCPEADAFIAKDAGLDTISQKIKQILRVSH